MGLRHEPCIGVSKAEVKDYTQSKPYVSVPLNLSELCTLNRPPQTVKTNCDEIESEVLARPTAVYAQ